jgi:hypothetical protein
VLREDLIAHSDLQNGIYANENLAPLCHELMEILRAKMGGGLSGSAGQ